MNLLARAHVWLGWLIGIPLLLWTASGLFMVSFPIEQVRGEHLRAEVPALPPILPVPPVLGGRTAQSLTLVQQSAGPVWIIAYADGGRRRADPETGKLLGPVGAAEARTLAEAAFAGEARLASVERFAADAAPLDLRRARPSWRATFEDDTRVYLDAETGEILAVRSALWRAFDFMWGLHIMDLQGREDSHHPTLVGFAWLAFAGVLIGLALLFRRRRRRIS